MTFYLNTQLPVLPAQVWIKPMIRYYFNYVKFPRKLRKYLKANYPELNLKTVSNALQNNYEISRYNDTFLKITFRQTNIGNYSLDTVLQLLEYGNREIEPAHLISKLMDNVLKNLKMGARGV